jgi:excisionase family DNA binding protein
VPRTTGEPSVTTLSAVEAADLVGVSKQTLYSAARRGEVPCRRVGRRFVFVREVLVDWLLMRGGAADDNP